MTNSTDITRRTEWVDAELLTTFHREQARMGRRVVMSSPAGVRGGYYVTTDQVTSVGGTLTERMARAGLR